MSRKLKRVPLSFNWPLHKVWGGYLNPYASQAGTCPDCEHGYDRQGGRPEANAALFSAQWYGNAPFDPKAYGAEPITPEDPAIWDTARRNYQRAPEFYATAKMRHFRQLFMDGFPGDDRPLIPFPSSEPGKAIAREAQRLYEDCFRGHWCHHLIQADVDALVAGERLWNFTRTPRDAGQAFVVAVRMGIHGTNSWLPTSNGHHPTAAEVNAWSRGRGMGHDAINQSTCVEARCAREGVPYRCQRCGGTGEIWPSLEIKQRCDNWTKEDPPAGDGYQLWENCSEGSPVSPVFATLDELCTWCETGATTFGSEKASREEWRTMLDEDFVHARVGNAIFT